MPGMAIRRRARGSVGGPQARALFVRLRPATAEAALALAARLGASNSEFVDLALEHALDSLDAQGVPDWWPRDAPEDHPQEVLIA